MPQEVRSHFELILWRFGFVSRASQNLSSILIERECFIGLIKQLEFNETYDFSLQILQLYNRILTLHPEYPEYLKLNVSDLIICGNKLIDFFYKLTTSKSGKIILTSYFLNLIFKMNLILRAVNSKRKIYKFGFNFYKFIQEQYKKIHFHIDNCLICYEACDFRIV